MDPALWLRTVMTNAELMRLNALEASGDLGRMTADFLLGLGLNPGPTDWG